MRHIAVAFVMFLAAFVFQVKTNAQLVPVNDQEEFIDSLKHEINYGPFFGLYKDNYFTVGTAPFQKPTALNSDVKFQISLGIRLAKLPWNSFIFITYTQKTFWNVFQNSMPMHDLNFNPAIGWSKPFFSKDQYIGKLAFLLEHESNGRDGEDSRSWNRISIYGSTIIDQWLMVHAKFWIPIIDGMNNKDILSYYGIFQGGIVCTTPNKKFSFGLTWLKRKGWNFNMNTIWDVSWKVSDKTNLNLFAQYYNGYGENLLDYNKFHSRFRVGIIFKPEFFSEF